MILVASDLEKGNVRLLRQKIQVALRKSSVTFPVPLDDCRLEGNGFKIRPCVGMGGHNNT
jgi:hypothetical protein